ncbi:organomercurial lyase MerB [Parafrigoribacterium mesophilum]|uniref:organomercurial lyase MerB n=1 Tax=Parafrigoribacterium mesophilum TaxID=433646 RepID=UPI0031FDF297
MMDASADMAERLNANTTGLEPGIWVPLLRLLAHGQPVEVWDLAAATGRTITQTREALDAISDTEYDEHGRIIGRGLTLQPTQFHFEVNKRPLFTWCALDTLIFPAILGTAARIESSCPATSTPILVHIDAAGAAKARPTTTVVSLIDTNRTRSIRSEFCNQVHFFASAEAAQPWLESHASGFVLPVVEAGQLGRRMAHALVEEAESKHPEPLARHSHYHTGSTLEK